MSKILILGDVHGSWGCMHRVMNAALTSFPDIELIIQVGDFGYGWEKQSGPLDHKVYDICRERAIPRIWYDGNHENFDRLERWQSGEIKDPKELLRASTPGWEYMPRGAILEWGDLHIGFMGGASSVDKQYRVEGVSWWPQETIKMSQVQEMLDEVGDGRTPDLMFSHDGPNMFGFGHRYGDEAGQVGVGDRKLLDVLLERFKPHHWFFGHHHEPWKGLFSNADQGILCAWRCAPIIESFKFVIYDIELQEATTCTATPNGTANLRDYGRPPKLRS